MILNNMFNTRTIKRLCGEIKIVSEQEKAAKNWIKKLKNNELEKESQNYDKFQQIILEDILGYERSEIQKASTGVKHVIQNHQSCPNLNKYDFTLDFL